MVRSRAWKCLESIRVVWLCGILQQNAPLAGAQAQGVKLPHTWQSTAEFRGCRLGMTVECTQSDTVRMTVFKTFIIGTDWKLECGAQIPKFVIIKWNATRSLLKFHTSGTHFVLKRVKNFETGFRSELSPPLWQNSLTSLLGQPHKYLFVCPKHLPGLLAEINKNSRS